MKVGARTGGRRGVRRGLASGLSWGARGEAGLCVQWCGSALGSISSRSGRRAAVGPRAPISAGISRESPNLGLCPAACLSQQPELARLAAPLISPPQPQPAPPSSSPMFIIVRPSVLVSARPSGSFTPAVLVLPAGHPVRPDAHAGRAPPPAPAGAPEGSARARPRADQAREVRSGRPLAS